MKDYNGNEITIEWLLALEKELESLRDALWREVCDGQREGKLQKILSNYGDHEKISEAAIICYRIREDMAKGE